MRLLMDHQAMIQGTSTALEVRMLENLQSHGRIFYFKEDLDVWIARIRQTGKSRVL